MVKKKYIEERKLVSRLIYRVLTGDLLVRKAILSFPVDCEDSSIKAAYHALIHVEADEELRKRDLLYKDEQDDYLEFLAETLQKGDDLPNNIVKSYDKYYKSANIRHSSTMKGFLKNLCKFLNV